MNPVCENVRARLNGLLLGEDDPEGEDDLRAHLEACAACRELFRDFVRQDLGLLRQAADAERPAVLRRWRGLPPARRAVPRARPSLMPFVAAAGLLLAAFGLLVSRATAPSTPPARPVAAASGAGDRAEQDRRQAEERLVEIERRRERLRQAVETAERERQEADRLRALEALARNARERHAAEALLEKAREDARREAERPAPAPPRSGTVAAMASLAAASGDVRVDGKRVQRGLWILPAQAVETGRESHALLAFPDGTLLRLQPESRFVGDAGPSGKRAVLSRGAVSADVVPQPPGSPMVFETPYGEATVLGTALRLAVDPDGASAARLDVLEGQVRLAAQEGTVEVRSGYSSVVAPGVPPALHPLPDQTFRFQDGLWPDPFFDGTRDTVLSEVDPEVPGGARLRLEPDGDTSNGYDETALIRWELASLPPGSKVRSATLSFVVANETKEAYAVSEVLAPWVEAEATWLEASRGRPWQSPGGTGPLDRAGRAVAMLGPASKGPLDVALGEEGLKLIQQWIDRPSTNHGLAVHGTSIRDGIQLHSREASRPDLRPRLTVTVSLPRRP